MDLLKRYLFFLMFIILIGLYGCGSHGDNIMGVEVSITNEELQENPLNNYFSRPVIKDEETALAIGTIIIQSYDYKLEYIDESQYIYEVQDKGDYWQVYSYIEHPTNENGEIIAWNWGGGTSVTFRKSDCQIVDITAN